MISDIIHEWTQTNLADNMTYLLNLESEKIERNASVVPICYVKESNTAQNSGYLVPFLTQQSQDSGYHQTYILEERGNRSPSPRTRRDTETIYI